LTGTPNIQDLQRLLDEAEAPSKAGVGAPVRTDNILEDLETLADTKDYVIEHFDYKYVAGCNDTKELKVILAILRQVLLRGLYFATAINGSDDLEKKAAILSWKKLFLTDPVVPLPPRAETERELESWLSELRTKETSLLSSAASKGISPTGSSLTLAPIENKRVERIVTGCLNNGVPTILTRSDAPPPRTEKNASASETRNQSPVSNFSQSEKPARPSSKIRSTDWRAWDKYTASIDEELSRLDDEQSEDAPVKPKIHPEPTPVVPVLNSDKQSKSLAVPGSSRPVLSRPPVSLDVKAPAGASEVEVTRLADMERVKGNEAFKAGDVEEALAYYTRSLNLLPSTAGLTNRALAFLRLDRFAEAEEDCDAALLRMNSEPVENSGLKFKALLRRGRAKLARGRYGMARRDFEECTALDPSSREARRLLVDARTKELEIEGDPNTVRGSPAPVQAVQPQIAPKRRMIIEEVDGGDDGDVKEDSNEGHDTRPVGETGGSVLKDTEGPVMQAPPEDPHHAHDTTYPTEIDTVNVIATENASAVSDDSCAHDQEGFDLVLESPDLHVVDESVPSSELDEASLLATLAALEMVEVDGVVEEDCEGKNADGCLSVTHVEEEKSKSPSPDVTNGMEVRGDPPSEPQPETKPVSAYHRWLATPDDNNGVQSSRGKDDRWATKVVRDDLSDTVTEEDEEMDIESVASEEGKVGAADQAEGTVPESGDGFLNAVHYVLGEMDSTVDVQTAGGGCEIKIGVTAPDEEGGTANGGLQTLEPKIDAKTSESAPRTQSIPSESGAETPPPPTGAEAYTNIEVGEAPPFPSLPPPTSLANFEAAHKLAMLSGPPNPGAWLTYLHDAVRTTPKGTVKKMVEGGKRPDEVFASVVRAAAEGVRGAQGHGCAQDENGTRTFSAIFSVFDELVGLKRVKLMVTFLGKKDAA
ncbi:Sperm associated antigen 1, partial [Gonapodya sp. JEL0774]